MEVLSSGAEPKECRAGWGGEFPEGRSLKEGEKQNETKHVGRRWFLRTYNPACHQTGKIRAVKRIMMAVDEGMHACMHAKSHQSGPTLCDPMGCSPPDYSVHGILQAGILKWVTC